MPYTDNDNNRLDNPVDPESDVEPEPFESVAKVTRIGPDGMPCLLTDRPCTSYQVRLEGGYIFHLLQNEMFDAVVESNIRYYMVTMGDDDVPLAIRVCV